MPRAQCDISYLILISRKKDISKMEKSTKNRDVAAPASPIKQQESDTNQGRIIEKEQQQRQEKVTIDHEEQEAASSGEGGSGGVSQAETGIKQRGKYRQYEDSQVIIEKIRSYRTQRYPDSEIMKLLDNMPRRTYYNYVKKLQEQDKQITEQWISENVEHFAEELMIFRETLCQKLRELQGIIDNKNMPSKDKMQAIQQYLELSEKLFKFEMSGRIDSMKSVKYNPPCPY
jgi:hypothetical protein